MALSAQLGEAVLFILRLFDVVETQLLQEVLGDAAHGGHVVQTRIFMFGSAGIGAPPLGPSEARFEIARHRPYRQRQAATDRHRLGLLATSLLAASMADLTG